MVNVHEVTQAFVAAATCIGTFVLIGTKAIEPEQGLSLMFALLGGLGLGYANGRKQG